MTQQEDLAPPVSEAGAPGAEERQWALLAHLSALTGFIIPFGNVIGPLIVWQIKKDTMPFVAEHAKEALNFQIPVCLAVVVSIVLFVVVLGMLLLPDVGRVGLVLTSDAAVKVTTGDTCHGR